jgi:hypothetical protein
MCCVGAKKRKAKIGVFHTPSRKTLIGALSLHGDQTSLQAELLHERGIGDALVLHGRASVWRLVARDFASRWSGPWNATAIGTLSYRQSTIFATAPENGISARFFQKVLHFVASHR